MIKTKIKTIDMIFIALCVAVISIFSQISVPILPGGVPLTLQTLAIAFCGYFLGMKKGTLAVFVYFLLGFAGVPVFAGFQGGLSVIIGPTGGFLWGFLIAAFCCGAGGNKKWWQALFFGVLGILLCHVLGVAQYVIISGRAWIDSFLLVSAPYLIKDFLSAAIALWCARILKKRAILPQ